MSAVIPDEDIFYCVGFLHSGTFDDWKALDDQNNEIIEFCDKNGIKIKQYLPHYKTRQEWINHFGSKWNTFQERKARFDPKMILSPGQRIFNFVQNEAHRFNCVKQEVKIKVLLISEVHGVVAFLFVQDYQILCK